jgi:hypothetical protein
MARAISRHGDMIKLRWAQSDLRPQRPFTRHIFNLGLLWPGEDVPKAEPENNKLNAGYLPLHLLFERRVARRLPVDLPVLMSRHSQRPRVQRPVWPQPLGPDGFTAPCNSIPRVLAEMRAVSPTR